MFIFEPIASLIVVAGVFIYFACKGSEKENLPTKETSDGHDFSKWYMELSEKNRKRNEERLEEIRYEKWLVEHQE